VTPIPASLFFAAFALLSWYGTGRYIAYAKRNAILDIPNERSSHAVPVPRGGGVVFVILLLVLFAVLLFVLPEERALWLSLLIGGAAVALVGWIDDKRGLPPKIRLLTHAAAVAWTLFQLGGLPRLSLGFALLPLGLFGSFLALVGGVWAINLYNFMDGIDGLAAGQAVLGALAAAFLLKGSSPSLVLALLMLSASVLGFLLWNRPPAKVFMGDAGSGFLGFAFFTLLLRTERGGELPALLWCVLFAPFIIDATLTLLKRMRARKRLSEAHREHLYQQFIIAGHSHTRVTGGVLLLSLCGIFVACGWPEYPLAVFAAVYGILGAGWRWGYRRMERKSTCKRVK